MSRKLTVIGLLLGLWRLQAASDAGAVNFFLTSTPSFGRYTDAPDSRTQGWLRNHFWGMLVYSPYFDSRLPWYPNGFVYFDLYAIYASGPLASQHPEWILKDSAGNNLYIPWGCSGGACPQFAADFSNPSFRQWWIGQAQALIATGYKGIFVDDVNMDFRIGDGNGNFIDPMDPNTGAPMAQEDWRQYMADFTAQIRAALPNTQIIHNSIWYAGPSQAIAQQDAAADYQNIEFGVNDTGLTGGNGPWSLDAILSYIDGLHAAGKGAIIGGVPNDPIGEEYALANYFLISSGADALGNNTATPANWWHAFDTNLGVPSGPRTTWNGLLRRDFSGGMVLVNPPQSRWVTVTLPGNFQRTDGVVVNSVSLGPSQGAVLTAVH